MEIEAITGAPNSEVINNFILALLKKDVVLGMEAIAEAKKNNVDMKVYMKLILHKLRQALLIKYAPAIAKRLIGDGEEQKSLKSLVKEHSASITSVLLRELLDCYSQIDRSFIPELPLELALIKIINNRNA